MGTLFSCKYYFSGRHNHPLSIHTTCLVIGVLPDSELVQLKLNIGTSVGDSTPTEAENGTPTYISGCLWMDEKENWKIDNLKELAGI